MVKKKTTSHVRAGGKYEKVKERIGSGEDIALKAIADLVAYKLHQRPENHGPEANFITAEHLLAQYVSEHFASMRSLDSRLRKLGDDVSGLGSFAEDVYNYYCQRRNN
jgi:hypothetical protein